MQWFLGRWTGGNAERVRAAGSSRADHFDLTVRLGPVPAHGETLVVSHRDDADARVPELPLA